MTKYEIAKKLHVTHQAVYKWFSGKSMPSHENLVALSKLTDKDLATVLNGFLDLQKKYEKNKKSPSIKKPTKSPFPL